MSLRAPLSLAPTLALIAALFALPSVASAQTDDERAVMAVVQKLFDGMRARDTVAMKSVFAPGAQLLGLVERDGATTLRSTPATQFVASIAAAPADRELIEVVYDAEVRIDGNLATYWAFYTLHVGEQFSHCGYDAVHLFRMSDGWKIVSLADTRRREGCER